MTKKPDWEAIESAFRAGSLSIRNIADQHGVSDTAIRKRATKHGWQRDLTEQVQKAARDKLVRKKVREAGSQEQLRTDAEIIEEASTEAASVVLRHRAGLAQWRSISDKLCAALAEMDVNEDNHDKFSRSLNAGVDAQLKVIKGERQAYNLDEPGDSEDEPQRVNKVEIAIVGQDATDTGDEAAS
ncbi:hypothetical protein ELY33_17140 [Vreelandella andesensis]|uniref:Terminase n=1 Tax=Vreelandella andesensis TaxID=447567 RepID=A0A433KF08_9GAMM|nr:hypothetical protein [Halomonas andesensis]RUR26833.1 hypothetical protein ELY33_17140 [Halomonas andesensis]